MIRVFHDRPYGRFIEIQNKLRRKKPSRTNQGSNFFEGSFSFWDFVGTPIQFRRERQSQLLKENRPIKNITRTLRIHSQKPFRNNIEKWSNILTCGLLVFNIMYELVKTYSSNASCDLKVLCKRAGLKNFTKLTRKYLRLKKGFRRQFIWK